MARRKNRLPVIRDPLQHAESTRHRTYSESERVSIWEPFASYCTTGQFARLDEGYVRHCGPTAITNLLLTLDRRYGYLQKTAGPDNAQIGQRDAQPGQDSPDTRAELSKADVFRTVCRIGRKILAYWNSDVLRHFGGTYDWMTGRYIRECFRYFGVPCDTLADGIFLGIGKAAREGAMTENSRLLPGALKVTGHVGTDPRRLEEELRRGKLLYLQLHWHPSYGDHHVLCYGCRILEDAEKKQRLLYLLIADGWNAAPRYVEASAMLLRHYYTIG